MGRSKVKTKILKSVGNKDVLNMFSEMLGISEDPESSSVNVKIVFNKYEHLKTAYKRYIKLFDLLVISNAVKKQPNIENYIIDYIGLLRNIEQELFSTVREFSEIEKLDITLVSTDDQNKIKVAYANIKDTKLTESIIVTCKNLIAYKKDIGDQNNLSGTFLQRIPGMQFCPIHGADGINFKFLYNQLGNTDKDKLYLLTILHKLFSISHSVYETISSPDIDVNEFVEIVMNSVAEVRKQIPRCDAAFNKIIESVDLLKGNFGDYYKDYVASNNPTSIMENFIIDVSEKTEATPQLTNQFRKIISYYRKVASQQSNNPKLGMLFKHLDKNFDKLDRSFKGEPDTTEPDTTEPESKLEDIEIHDENIIVPEYAKTPEILAVKEPDSPESRSLDEFTLV